MHLQISPEAPILVRDAATAVLALHIGAGFTGLLSGAAALATRKGERLHRVAGNTFFVSMLTMSGVGAAVSPFLPQWSNVPAGIFTFYLVASAWMTVIRKEGYVGRFEVAASIVALGTCVALLGFAWVGAHSPKGLIDGQPYQAALVFAVLAALAAGMDLRVILRRGVAGVQRISRHIWRMCLALFIASGSVFLGQPQVFPAPLHGSPILIVLALAPLGFLIFWMIRVRFTRAPRPVGFASPLPAS